MEDLPSELLDRELVRSEQMLDWEKALAQFVEERLANGAKNLLDELSPIFERILLQGALNKTSGRKIEAAELLGWGRNTLTRKLKELGVEES